MMCHEDMNFLEMKETIKSEIDEENVNEYKNGYLKSRYLKKEDLKRREHTKQKENLIQQLKKIEFFKKEDSYFNWSKSGNGKKSVKRTVPLTCIPLTRRGLEDGRKTKKLFIKC